MSWPVIAAIVWVLAAAVTALLPYKRQFPPGIILLFLAPLLIAWLALEHGPIVGLAALAAFASMFRNPLIYFWRKWQGLPAQRHEQPPQEPQP
ncbi:DUF2484 family protein [Neogemmobacter tilapiae]|uniref:DUF2484 family protein n=1 Tax=Neogemmobacter tilapiae TaxID=875041 RepID=A0A918WLI8_9RHOB|nr:DUF2484 family protein [Gemmobacter tilapiae]GHC57253.1 hypothetical protein GCM10007315_20810 [Gemmobacter tilapiae]